MDAIGKIWDRMPAGDAVRQVQVPASLTSALLVRHNPQLPDYVSQADRSIFDTAYAVWQVRA